MPSNSVMRLRKGMCLSWGNERGDSVPAGAVDEDELLAHPHRRTREIDETRLVLDGAGVRLLRLGTRARRTAVEPDLGVAVVGVDGGAARFAPCAG